MFLVEIYIFTSYTSRTISILLFFCEASLLLFCQKKNPTAIAATRRIMKNTFVKIAKILPTINKTIIIPNPIKSTEKSIISPCFLHL